MANDGCECVKTNAGVEACDDLDNNCNGIVDEGFDFMTDVVNCGGCNVTCSFPFATATCMSGVCKQGACLPGFYDRDPLVPGCETACEKSNGGVEICDGQDNDCNGVVDDNPMAGPLVCRSMGVCAGVQPTCMGQTGWICKYPATYQDVEDMAKRLRRPRQRLRRQGRRGVPDRPGVHGRLGRVRRTRTACGSATTPCRRATTAATARPSRRAPRSATASTTTATARSTSSTRRPTAPATTS